MKFNSSETSIKKASLINALSKYTNIFLGIFFSAILARILTPDDYGIVAIVTVFSTFFTVLSNCGLQIAVIQKKEFSQDDINTLFTFSIYFGLILSIFFSISSIFISKFYNNPVYIPISLILTISLFFNTINAVPSGLLQKEKKFLLIGIRLVVVSFLTYGITIFLALNNFKYYALVIQSVISSLLIFLWNLKNVKVKFTKKINWKILQEIKGYSGYNFLFNLFNYFTRNLDKIIIGKAIGNSNLAQYNKAYRFMLYPVQNLTNIITPTLHPIFADFQNDTEYIYNQYIKILKILSLIGVFVTPLCFCCSKEIILLVYGNQWDIAVGCFKYMSIAIWTQMICGTAGAIFNSLNDTRTLFFISIFEVFIMFIAILIGVHQGNIVTVAKFTSIALISNFFSSFIPLIVHTMKKNFFLFISNFIYDFIIIFFLFMITFILQKFLNIENLFISLVIKSIFLSVVYIFLLAILKQIKYFYPIVPRKITILLKIQK